MERDSARSDELERRMLQLPQEQQDWLMDWMLRRVLPLDPTERDRYDEQLAAMSSDPELRWELEYMAEIFKATKPDGPKEA